MPPPPATDLGPSHLRGPRRPWRPPESGPSPSPSTLPSSPPPPPPPPSRLHRAEELAGRPCVVGSAAPLPLPLTQRGSEGPPRLLPWARGSRDAYAAWMPRARRLRKTFFRKTGSTKGFPSTVTEYARKGGKLYTTRRSRRSFWVITFWKMFFG